MPAERFTFVTCPLACAACGTVVKELRWLHEPVTPCPCGAPRTVAEDLRAKAHAVLGDEIDRVIEHGLCHADGTPRRFRSRQALHEAERAAGWRVLERGERFPGSQSRARRA
jgi:hypothetical protein